MSKAKKTVISIVSSICALLIIAGAILGLFIYKSKKEVSTENNSTAQRIPVPENMKTIEITPAENFAGGSGTADDPYQIENAEQLALFREKVDGDEAYIYSSLYYILTNDIVINDVSDYDNWDNQAPKYGWTPIHGFNGTFDGNNKKIIGMFSCTADRSRDGECKAGLFSSMSFNTIIKNVNIEKAYLNLLDLGDAGCISSSALSGKLSNCSANGKIIAAEGSNVGGLLGTSGCVEISNCVNNTSLYGEKGTVLGGIVGYYSGHFMKDCINNGLIKGEKLSYIGGIAGYLNDNDCSSKAAEESENKDFQKNYVHREEATLTNLVNNGNLISCDGASIAGVAAHLSASRTKMCLNNIKNTGTIEVQTNCDNIAGVFATIGSSSFGCGGGVDLPLNSNSLLIMVDCENSGDIVLNDCPTHLTVSGFSAFVMAEGESNMQFVRCVNKGNGQDITSGIASNVFVRDGAKLTFDSCENHSEIKSSYGQMGGMIATLDIMPNKEKDLLPNFKIVNCVNYAPITSTATNLTAINGIGGIIGNIESSFEGACIYVNNCINKGVCTCVGTTAHMGGIIGHLLCKQGIKVAEIKDNLNEGSMNINKNTKVESKLDSVFVGGVCGLVSGENDIQNNKFTSIINIEGDKSGIIKDDTVGLIVNVEETTETE